MGLAGAAGVVATGVVIARGERRRRAYTPDQVREQLHARLAEAAQDSVPAPYNSDAYGVAGGRNRSRGVLRRCGGAAGVAARATVIPDRAG